MLVGESVVALHAGHLPKYRERTDCTKIGDRGIGAKARYVSSGRVSAVSGDTVRLSVRNGNLAKED